MNKNGFYGWKLTAIFWVLFLINTGFPLYGAGVINSYMATDLHMDRKMLGLAFTLFTLSSGFSAPLVSVCVNRLGARITLTLGGLLLAMGSFTMAFLVSTGLQAVLVFGVIVGFGFAFGGPIAIQTGVTLWFTKKRALALAIVLTGTGTGGIISATLLDKVIAIFDDNWRTGWLLVATLSVISTFVAALLVRNKPSDLGQIPDGILTSQGYDASREGKKHLKDNVYKARIDWTFSEAVRSPVIWFILIGGLIFSASYTMFLAHNVLYLKELGFSSADAALSLGVLTVSTIIGKAAFGFFGDRFEPRYIWAIAMVLFGGGILLAIKATNSIDIYIYSILIGSGFGASYICMMAMLSNYYGPTAYASLMGITLPVLTLGSASAPFLAGLVYDLYGSYTIDFYIASLLCAAGVLLALLAIPPKPAASHLEREKLKESQLGAILEQSKSTGVGL